MGENSQDKDALKVVVNCRHQSKLISADVKDRRGSPAGNRALE
jgi:hypothetical protein